MGREGCASSWNCLCEVSLPYFSWLLVIRFVGCQFRGATGPPMEVLNPKQALEVPCGVWQPCTRTLRWEPLSAPHHGGLRGGTANLSPLHDPNSEVCDVLTTTQLLSVGSRAQSQTSCVLILRSLHEITLSQDNGSKSRRDDS